MPKLSSLQRTKKVTFRWPDSDEVLNLVVKPDHFTGQNLEIMQQAIEGKEDSSVAQHKFLCEFLSNVISDWDLTDDDEKVLALDVETIFDNLPITLVASLLQRIQEELRVNPQTPGS
jgi:hypothetical protein